MFRSLLFDNRYSYIHCLLTSWGGVNHQAASWHPFDGLQLAQTSAMEVSQCVKPRCLGVHGQLSGKLVLTCKWCEMKKKLSKRAVLVQLVVDQFVSPDPAVPNTV